MHAKLLQSCQLCATLWTAAGQAPLFMGIFQARMLEWVAVPSSRGSSQPRDRTCCISYICIGRIVFFFFSFFFFFTTSATCGEGNGTPLQYSCLENPVDGGAWWAAVHGVAKSRTRLSDFTFTFHFHALEKEMVPHSSILAWRIPGTEESVGLPSMGSHRFGHD